MHIVYREYQIKTQTFLTDTNGRIKVIIYRGELYHERENS